MSEKKDLKQLIAPFMLSLPVLLPVLVIVGMVSYRLCRYIVPLYDTELRVKLETKDDSFTKNNLYKDFDVLTTTDKVLTEVQVLKSDLIIKKTLRAMNLPITYKRVGQLMDTELYPDSPFIVEIDSNQTIPKNTFYSLEIFPDESIELSKNIALIKTKFGKWVDFEGGKIKISKNKNWLNKHKLNELYGTYEFKVNTLKGLKSDFVADNLLVKEIDKDIDIIRINFQGENPQKIADFANLLVATFTKDYLETKVQAAHLTSNFIDSQIVDIKERLVESEINLERFRYDKKVLNSKQQLEIGLKKIAQLDVQLANLSLKKITMDSLIVYVENEDEDYINYAPSFESYGGLLFVELMKKYQSLLDERRSLSAQYTRESRELDEINEKLLQTKGYIKNSIVNHRELVKYQYDLLSDRVKLEKERFTDLPSKERKFLGYEREFRQNEDIYNFLSKKKMEADIAKSVDLAFHKIIQEAQVPSMAVSPNKKFIAALMVLSVFLIIVFLVYLINFLKTGIKSYEEIERFFGHSIHGFLVTDSTENYQFNTDLMTDIVSLKREKQIIVVASGHKGEGKSYFTRALLKTQSIFNKSRTKVISEGKLNFTSVKNASFEELNKWRFAGYDRSFFLTNYDQVLIDTHSINSSKEESLLLAHADHVFFVMDFRKTKTKDLEFIKNFLESNPIKSYSLILNNYSLFTNHLGEINIANSYKGSKKGLINRVTYLKNWYKAWWAI